MRNGEQEGCAAARSVLTIPTKGCGQEKAANKHSELSNAFTKEVTSTPHLTCNTSCIKVILRIKPQDLL